MKKPNYKKANKELMNLLALEPEPKKTLSKNKIIDLTEESSEVVYQFTEHDFTVIMDKQNTIWRVQTNQEDGVTKVT